MRTVVDAGNTQAPALACLIAMGFRVSRVDGRSDMLRAESPAHILIAESPVALLGLAAMIEQRGEGWRPTDDEIEQLLKIDQADA